jgi:3-oxoacyl-[acyl-carrier protein] reductase
MRMKDDEWDAVIDTNLKAVFRMSQAGHARHDEGPLYGRIINITSVVGSSATPGQANYAAAKAGVAGMTRALARSSAAATSRSIAWRRASSIPT